MAKFYGSIGYAKTIEKASGVWVEDIIERKYSGDVIKNSRRWQPGENLNDNLTVNNEISIVSDAFANDNFYAMRYINWMGTNWKITNVDVQRPRLILSIGGVYNGVTSSTSSNA
jgi:hypothetical protein